MSKVSFFALYNDGSKYSVIYDGSTWLGDTAGGRMSVPWRVNDAEFVRYGFDYEPPKGLRACDWVENARRFTAEVALVTVPQRPATAPPIQQAEPGRVHLEERLPGESRLSQLQRSFGAGVMQARLERQQTHHNQSAESISEAERRDTAKVAAARGLASDALHALKPRGGGGGFGEGFVVDE
jgi:hypothetical protein